MKSKCTFILKTSIALVLALLMLVGSISGVIAATVDMAESGYDMGTVYFTPYHGSDGAGWIKDNKTILARYLPGDNSWQTAQASDTGRTIAGQRVYTASLQNRYGGTDNLYFRAGSNINDYDQTSNEQHPFSSWTTTHWDKYWNGSSWATPSYDTFKVYNNGTALSTLSFNSTTKKYTGTASLTAGTSYKLNIYDGVRYWANSGAGTLTDTGSATMYRYGSGGSGDGFSITPEVTGTYSFEWSLAGAGNREDTGTFKVTYPTIYTVSYTLGTHVNYSSVSGGTKTANGTIKATSGSNVALTVSYDTNYTYDSSTSTLNGATASNSNKTFTFSSISANKSITINAKSSLTALSAPSITYNSSSASTQTMNASKGSKARIAWSAVSNAGSYEVYKGSSLVTTTTNTYYDIERGYSYGGAYTVKAVPSNSSAYSTSAASNSITFTFNKVALTAPTVTPSKSTIVRNETVTFSISGGASSGTLGTDYKYQHSGANNTTYSDVTGSSWTSGQLDNTTSSDVSDVFKFKTVAISTDYYSSSTGTTDKTITVKPAFGVDSGSSGTFTPGTATAMTYDSSTGYYSLSVTLTSTSNYYFRINQMGASAKWSSSWNGSYPNVYDVNLDGAKVTADSDVSSWDNKASMHYNGAAKKIVIWFDYANKKVWITGNSTKYNVTITQPSATGSSIKVNDATTSPQEFYEGDTVNYSVTAGTGNVITSVTVGGTTTNVNRQTSYTGSFEISAATAISATVVPQYSITASSATGGTYTVKRDGTAVTKFIAGDQLTLTPSPSTHYNFTKFTVTGGKSATLTANPSTLDTTGATGNITITPTWTAKSYNVSVAAKYTNNAYDNLSDFTQTFSTAPAVTIGSSTATNPTGVAVTAPGTDPSGYVWVGWKTSNGSFANAANKDTTFYPNANNAQAVACYRKIHSITISVDNTGTGAGTATTNVATVAAGGSYTITSTAKSGSAIQSILVNGTSKGTNASTTVSSVSADQSVVVKFTSVVDLKGSFDNWGSGQNMVSNAAGTSFSTTVTVNANTATEFKLMNNSAWAASGVDTVDNWELNGIATHTTSGNNLKITPTVKAKITFVSNGSKFTSITAIPYDSTTYNVTLKNVTGSTITATYMGTEYTTASGDAVVPVYSGTEISFTVTADSGKYLSGLTTSAGSLSPAFSVGDSYTGKISNVTSARTVTPTVANKFSITAKTNKSSRGTVSVSPASARPSQTVTITVSPKAGILQTLTYEYAGGKKYERNFNNNTWNEVTASSGAAAPASVSGKGDLATTGADADLAALAADATYTFTLDSNPTGAVTVNATFAPYSAESNWYYNGYDTSGNKVTAYWGKQMTEGMVSGEKFSYYHVEGRTGSDQLFTVSDGRVADTRYVYFTRPKSYSYWNQSNSPKAHFWKNGGAEYDTWPGTTMTWVYDNDMGEAVFKIAIPVGADRVSFNDASNNGQQQTVDIDLTNTSGAYYVSGWNDGENKYNYGTWNTGYADQGYVASGTEYFYDSERYTADYSTKGFYNHNTNSKDYTKPKDLGTSTGDYYVNVLYAGKTYTINGVTKTVGAKDLVIWTTEPLNDDGDTVTVYAKDGAIRSESFGSTYANIADTQIVASASSTTSIGTSQNGNISGQTYETYKAGKGETIYIRTTINTTAGNGADTTTNRNKYYVRGFCINGEVYELKTWDSSGVYTTSYKIPEDYESKYVEITPIYYLKDTENHPIVTYRVTGFTDELKEVGAGKPGWGDTLYTYPFYGKLGSQNNALGAYPGQPMVYYKGQYQMQIPQQSTAWDVYLSDSALSGTDAQKKTKISTTNVSGVTMSNGYYDSVHRLIMGYGNNGSSSDHVQTYDYGDFFKIFNEKAPVDNIVFDFKYETKKHNFENQPAASVTKSTLDTNYGTNGNGFEILTNFHGRHVDLFGTPLSGDAADPEKTTPVYVISIGGVNGSAGVENIAGYYATEWLVYTSSASTPSSSASYTRASAGGKSSIPPEVLVLNDDDATSFNTTTYPSADANHSITDWKALYTALEAYRGKPVMISYEAADAQIGSLNYATSGGGGATRNDGRWLYSKNGETITSKIRVDVSEDNGVTYTPNDDLSTPVTDLDAYFTNAEADGETTYTTTIDPDETFDFEAHSNNADYKFMGWYMADGTKITSDNIGHTERSGSYTFVARFMHFTGGQLILGHKAATDSTYKGSGTATIAVTVKNGSDETVREWAASSSDVTIDDKIINNQNTAYTITVTLNAAGSGEDTYARTTCSAANTFFGNQSAYTSMPQTFSFSVGDLFSGTTQNVKKITYNSFFNQVSYTYKYTFNFTARDGSTKSYVREGTLTAAQREAYVEESGGVKLLKKTFVNTLIPYESNFGKNVSWTVTDANRTFTATTSGGTVTGYTLTKSISASQSDITGNLTATFDLPYSHTNGVATITDTQVLKTTSENLIINGLSFGQLLQNGDDYVVAPDFIDDNGESLRFQYWRVYKTKTTGEYTDADEVARCYFPKFNLVACDNYYITPYYVGSSEAVDKPHLESGVYTTVSYLGTTRNQWNTNGENAEYNTVAGKAAASDLLYNDFLLAFNYNGYDIKNNDENVAGLVDLGIIVERIQKLDIKQDGTPYTDPSNYSGLEENLDTVESVANGGTATGFTKHAISKTSLDNKNRIEIYDAFYNSAGWLKDEQEAARAYGYKNYVYRAYTYMKLSDGSIVLSDTPAYFTMYDVAVATATSN